MMFICMPSADVGPFLEQPSNTLRRACLQGILANGLSAEEDWLFVGEVWHITENFPCLWPCGSLFSSIFAGPVQSRFDLVRWLCAAKSRIVLYDIPACQTILLPFVCYKRHMRLEIVVKIELDIVIVGIENGANI